METGSFARSWNEVYFVRSSLWILVRFSKMNDAFMLLAETLFVLGTLFADAFVLETSGKFAQYVGRAAFFLLLKNFILLQFDLILPRYNSSINFFDEIVVWTVYQAARDFGLGLLVLIGKDVLKRFFDVDNYVHIRAAVTVRILGIHTEAKWGKAHTLQNNSKLGLVDNVLTLRERNSVAISIFGEDKGDALLYILLCAW